MKDVYEVDLKKIEKLTKDYKKKLDSFYEERDQPLRAAYVVAGSFMGRAEKMRNLIETDPAYINDPVLKDLIELIANMTTVLRVMIYSLGEAFLLLKEGELKPLMTSLNVLSGFCEPTGDYLRSLHKEIVQTKKSSKNLKLKVSKNVHKELKEWLKRVEASKKEQAGVF